MKFITDIEEIQLYCDLTNLNTVHWWQKFNRTYFGWMAPCHYSSCFIIFLSLITRLQSISVHDFWRELGSPLSFIMIWVLELNIRVSYKGSICVHYNSIMKNSPCKNDFSGGWKVSKFWRSDCKKNSHNFHSKTTV